MAILRREGVEVGDIAAAFGVHRVTVYRWYAHLDRTAAAGAADPCPLDD